METSEHSNEHWASTVCLVPAFLAPSAQEGIASTPSQGWHWLKRAPTSPGPTLSCLLLQASMSSLPSLNPTNAVNCETIGTKV